MLNAVTSTLDRLGGVASEVQEGAVTSEVRDYIAGNTELEPDIKQNAERVLADVK